MIRRRQRRRRGDYHNNPRSSSLLLLVFKRANKCTRTYRERVREREKNARGDPFLYPRRGETLICEATRKGFSAFFIVSCPRDLCRRPGKDLLVGCLEKPFFSSRLRCFLFFFLATFREGRENFLPRYSDEDRGYKNV